jgi:hypothetical protein
VSIFDRKYLLGARQGAQATADLNFLTGTLDSRITFSRADTTPVASYFDATGVMRFGPTNLMTFSADMTAWTLTNTTATLASGAAPDGSNTMNRIAETATTSTHYINRNIAVVAGTVYTTSIYAKAAERQYLQVNYDDGTNGAYATFDLTGGTITGALTARGTGTAIGAAITAIGNGIYRCSITASHGSTTGRMLVSLAITANPAVAPSYAGNAGSGLLVWGAQIEANTAPGPYVATVAAALSGPRFDYGASPGGVTNWIRNSVATGASGATPPTNWTAGSGNLGITVTNVGPSTDAQGLPAIDITLSGTASGTSALVGLQGFESATQIPAITGQTWTTACNLQLVSGTLNGLTIGVDVAERTIAGALVTVHSSSVSPTGTMTRYSSTATFSGGTTVAYVGPALRWSLTSGQTINVTIRVSQPQCEQAASAGTYVPTSGMALNSGAAPLGLLIEEGRTNLAFPSADPATLFTTSGVTLTAASGTAPDGTVTMTKMTESATNVAHYTSKLSLVTASATMTFSLFAQAQQVQFLQLYYDDGSANGMQATFDLINGTASAAATRGTGTATGVSITPFGRGIYRLSITGVAAAATNIRYGAILSQTISNGFASPYLGNGPNGLLIWGIQFEAGVFATSYIPTVAGAVSRLADVATMPVTVPAAYAVAAEVMVPIVINNSIVQGLAVLDDGTANNRVPLRIITAAIGSASVVAGAGTTQPIAAGTVTANTALKGAYSAGAGALTAAFAGGVSAPGSGALPAGLTTLRIGTNAFGGGYLDGWVRRVRYYARPLSNSELQTVTR